MSEKGVDLGEPLIQCSIFSREDPQIEDSYLRMLKTLGSSEILSQSQFLIFRLLSFFYLLGFGLCSNFDTFFKKNSSNFIFNELGNNNNSVILWSILIHIPRSLARKGYNWKVNTDLDAKCNYKQPINR